jgi:hypothetical protein
MRVRKHDKRANLAGFANNHKRIATAKDDAVRAQADPSRRMRHTHERLAMMTLA